MITTTNNDNFTFSQDVNLWKLMGDFNLHGITAPGKVVYFKFLCATNQLPSDLYS